MDFGLFVELSIKENIKEMGYPVWIAHFFCGHEFYFLIKAPNSLS